MSAGCTLAAVAIVIASTVPPLPAVRLAALVLNPVAYPVADSVWRPRLTFVVARADAIRRSATGVGHADGRVVRAGWRRAILDTILASTLSEGPASLVAARRKEFLQLRSVL